MRLTPRLLSLFLILSTTGYSATQVDVYKPDDMKVSGPLYSEYKMVLHEDISLLLPDKASNFYHSSDYIFTSNNTSSPADLSFYGENDKRGEVMHNCGATFHHLGYVRFISWINTWGGDDKDTTVSAYGGAISGGDGDSFLFLDNGAILFSHITYDSSEWGANHSNISVHGGAIHTYTAQSESVEFTGNESVTLEYISIINEHDTNYCYKNLSALGGAIYTGNLQISHTTGSVSLNNNRIHQGVCTDLEGVGKGGAAYITSSLNISNNRSNVALDSNSILVANTAEGGALYLMENSSSKISDNLLHIQFRANKVQAAADADFNFADDSLSATCEAMGGAAYIAGELFMERNSGNITFESNTATADYSKVLENGRSEEHDNDPAYALGGAIFLASGAHLGINHNGTENTTGMGNVTFSGNEVSTIGTSGGIALGGALYLNSDATVEISHNTGNVSFSDNKAAEGGAIYFTAGSTGTISKNGSVLFSGNTAEAGSAIYAESGSKVDICDNTGSITFTNNESATGAIHVCSSAEVNLRNNAAVILEGSNDKDMCVLYGEAGSTARISGNAGVTVTGQEMVYSSIIRTAGALYLHDNTGAVELNNNSALLASGGVFTLEGSSALLSICGNSGSIIATGNYAAKAGGLIHAASGSHILICDNADVTITGNDSRSGAAAIDSDGSIHIRNNAGRVIFGNNRVYDEENGFTMCSIRADNAQFSAAAGHSIEFQDSIIISPANEETPALVLNADYTDSSGTTHKQGGDIIFTGAAADTTNADSSVDTAAPRHSKIDGDTTLHNGRLIVTQQAMLAGNSLSTTERSGATVVLSQGGYLNQAAVNIATGTTLQAGDADIPLLLGTAPMEAETLQQLIENTSVCGHFGGSALTLQSGSTLTLQSGSTYTMYGGILDLCGGSLNLSTGTDAITLSSTIAPTLIGEEYVLLLFSGVNHCEYDEYLLFTYNGYEYGAEHLVYSSDERAVYLRNVIIPEPATATLCFLALAALTTRRRRA